MKKPSKSDGRHRLYEAKLISMDNHFKKWLQKQIHINWKHLPVAGQLASQHFDFNHLELMKPRTGSFSIASIAAQCFDSYRTVQLNACRVNRRFQMDVKKYSPGVDIPTYIPDLVKPDALKREEILNALRSISRENSKHTLMGPYNQAVIDEIVGKHLEPLFESIVEQFHNALAIVEHHKQMADLAVCPTCYVSYVFERTRDNYERKLIDLHNEISAMNELVVETPKVSIVAGIRNLLTSSSQRVHPAHSAYEQQLTIIFALIDDLNMRGWLEAICDYVHVPALPPVLSSDATIDEGSVVSVYEKSYVEDWGSGRPVADTSDTHVTEIDDLPPAYSAVGE